MSALYVWGNHHSSNQTGFRNKLHQLVLQHTNFNSLAFQLSLQAVKSIPIFWQDWPATLILILGDTKLNSENSLEQAIDVYTQLYKTLKNLPSYTVITCGPMLPWDPSPLLRDKLEALDSALTQLNQAHPERYVSLLHTFKPSDFKFDEQLSKKGSTLLARSILRALNSIDRVRAFNRLQTQNGRHNLDSQLSQLKISLPGSE